MRGIKEIVLIGILTLASIACSSAFRVREQDNPYNRDGNKKILSLRQDFPQCGELWFRQVESMDGEKQKWLSDDKVRVHLVDNGSVTVQVVSYPPYEPCEVFLERDVEKITQRRNAVLAVFSGVTDAFEWFGGVVIDLFFNNRGEFFVRERTFSGDIKDKMVVKGNKIVIGIH
jgi:hypothetical protein